MKNGGEAGKDRAFKHGIAEEEADALDEFVTKNPPRVDPAKARHVSRMVAIDDLSADYLLSVSTATHKTPADVISDLIREKITVGVH